MNTQWMNEADYQCRRASATRCGTASSSLRAPLTVVSVAFRPATSTTRRSSTLPNPVSTAMVASCGRVLIPSPLRRFSDLVDQVVVIGVGEGFEIWSTAYFDEVMVAEEEDYARALESAEGR